MDGTIKMSRDDIIQHLRSIVMMCAIIPHDDLQAHVDACRESKAVWDAIGFVHNPTDYRDYLFSDGDKRAKIQLEITELILKIGDLARAHDENVLEQQR